MKALVKTKRGVGNIEVKDVPMVKIPKDNFVLIKVKACGVCGTDLRIWQDAHQYWPPVTLGHEFAGEVVEVGKDVKKYKVGDRVVSEPNTGSCGVCELCRTGRMHLCKEKLTLGWRIDGAFTDYVTVPEHVLRPIPDNVDYTLAALAEPLAVLMYDTAENAKIQLNDFVVILGCGPIGILAAYAAKMQGAREVVITGLDKSEYCRFDVAKKVGADVVINTQHEDVYEKVMEMTNGEGADVVIETSGAAPCIAQSVSLLKKAGTIIGIGVTKGAVPFPWNEAVYKDIYITYNMSTSYRSWGRALDRLSKDGDILRNVITRTAKIDDWEEVFQSMIDEKDIKVIFTFNDDDEDKDKE